MQVSGRAERIAWESAWIAISPSHGIPPAGPARIVRVRAYSRAMVWLLGASGTQAHS